MKKKLIIVSAAAVLLTVILCLFMTDAVTSMQKQSSIKHLGAFKKSNSIASATITLTTGERFKITDDKTIAAIKLKMKQFGKSSCAGKYTGKTLGVADFFDSEREKNYSFNFSKKQLAVSGYAFELKGFSPYRFFKGYLRSAANSNSIKRLTGIKYASASVPTKNGRKTVTRKKHLAALKSKLVSFELSHHICEIAGDKIKYDDYILIKSTSSELFQIFYSDSYIQFNGFDYKVVNNGLSGLAAKISAPEKALSKTQSAPADKTPRA